MSGFWAGGAAEHRRALKQERDAVIQRLSSLLHSTTTATERNRLELQLEAAEATYQEKLQTARHFLF